MGKHSYQTFLKWTGNKGRGTENYCAYNRAYEIEVQNKPVIKGSSDPAFRGDKTKYNPEELFVASTSSCHMLWYLHLCAEASVIVVDYCDRSVGKMQENDDGSGQFTEIILQPEVIITTNSSLERAEQLHQEAHKFCFIANSVNFPIACNPAMKRR
jgi:organic hydroperoxide reductase OsmC/OhrA